MIGLYNISDCREDVYAEEFMVEGISDELIEGLDQDFFARGLLPGFEHRVLNMVVNGSRGGIMN